MFQRETPGLAPHFNQTLVRGVVDIDREAGELTDGVDNPLLLSVGQKTQAQAVGIDFGL